MKATLGIGILALVIVWVLAIGWATMLAVGIIHAEVLPAVIPAGFGPCVALGVLITIITGSSAARS